MEKSTPPPLP